VQCHFSCDVLEAFHQEVRRAHARLDRAEGMLDRLSARAHRLWVLIEPPLNVFEHMFVFPTGDATPNAGSALILDRTCATSIGPVAIKLYMGHRNIQNTVGYTQLS
jgi:hypothetical protein